MESNSQILQLCRLCLDKDSVNIPIFEEPGDIRQIYLKISSCLPVKVSRDDRLPKKICDGCSHKLDLVYEFRNTSVSAEKQLLEWLEDTNLISETVAKSTQQSSETNTQQNRPTETQVKQEEIDPSDIQKEEDEEDDKNYLFEQNFQDSSAAPGPSATTDVAEEEEEEPPPPKRAKRTAAVKAAIAMDQSDDDDEDDLGEPLTKVEDESDDSEGDDQEAPFVDVPSTSADDQPGPSGVGKEGEAPKNIVKRLIFLPFSPTLEVLQHPTTDVTQCDSASYVNKKIDKTGAYNKELVTCDPLSINSDPLVIKCESISIKSEIVLPNSPGENELTNSETLDDDSAYNTQEISSTVASRKKSKSNRAENRIKKKEADRARRLRMKSNPLQLAELQEKERLKYIRKKEKGIIKNINEMTASEQKIKRMKWKTYSTTYRRKRSINCVTTSKDNVI